MLRSLFPFANVWRKHRKNPACAGCHKMMDPIGFSLENFDALGTWRTNDSGFRIDPSGTMFDGARLNGPASLRQAVLAHSDLFLETIGGNLLAYGMGRVLEPSDMPTVRAVVKEAARNNNRFLSPGSGGGEERTISNETSGRKCTSGDRRCCRRTKKPPRKGGCRQYGRPQEE